MPKITSTIRDIPPCKDCKRPEKSPACHGRCEAFKAWRETLESVNKKRVEYRDAPRPAYRDPNTGRRW